MALVAKVRGALLLEAVDTKAAALGLAPGLTLADARARVPDLAVRDHDPVADQALLEALADACGRYTPTVAIAAASDGLLLDISGCEHVFVGGEHGLRNDALRRFGRLGLTVQAAVADTPAAAIALARYAAALDKITDLPVQALELGAEATTALRRAGLRVIGDVAAQSRSALAARFGNAMLGRLAAILGEEDARLIPRRAPPPVLTEARLAEPILRSQEALRVISDLALQTARALEARGMGGRRFEVTLFRTDHHVARLAVDTAQPLRDPRRIAKLFAERLDSLADPLDPGFGFDLIRLAVPLLEPLEALQLKLEGGAAVENSMAALIDQLSTRLGRERVTRAVPGDSHIPEQATFDLPAIADTPATVWSIPEPGEPPQRPLYLFDPPERIEVMAEVPDGPPRRFKWRAQMHDVLRHEGPERIAAEWWRRKNGKGLTRDYYRVEDVRGRRFWLFRHGLYGREKAQPNWYLHGLFA